MKFKCILAWFASLLIVGCVGTDVPSDAPPIETTLTGRVIDAVTSNPVTTSQITTTPATASVVTSADGSFTIPKMSAGQYTLTVTKDSYQASSVVVTLKEGNNTQGDILLSPLSAKLKVLESTLDFGSVNNSMNLTLNNENKVGTVTWKATSDQNWINLGQSSGSISTGSTSLSVIVNRSSMTNYGNYSGNIFITSASGNATIPISIVVVNPNAPQISVSPSTIDFGSSTNVGSITVSNSGTGTLDWVAVANQTWVNVGAIKGQLFTGQKATIALTVSRGNLAVGIHSADVLFTAAGVTQKSTITIQIVNGTPAGTTLSVISHNDNSIDLGWDASTLANFSAYKIYYSLTPGVSQMNSLGPVISVRNTVSGTISSLLGSTGYYARVFVCSDADICTGSNEVSVTTDQKLGTWTIGEQFDGIDFNGVNAKSESNVIAWGKGGVVLYDGVQWVKAVGLPAGDVQSADFGTSGTVYVVTQKSYSDRPVLAKKIGGAWSVDTLPGSGYSYKYSIAVDSNGTIFYSEGQSRIWMKKINSSWAFRDLNSTGWKISRNNWTNEIYVNSPELSANPGLYRWNGSTWIVADTNGNYLKVGFSKTATILKITSSSGGGSHVFAKNSPQFDKNKPILGWNSQVNVAVTYDGTLVFVFGETDGSGMNKLYKCTTESDCIDIKSPTSNYIAASVMTNSTSGWAVGDKGTILRYQ